MHLEKWNHATKQLEPKSIHY